MTAEQPKTIKPGHHTSEFKFALGVVLTVVGGMAAALAANPSVPGWVAISASALAVGIASAGYSVSRGNAKK